MDDKVMWQALLLLLLLSECHGFQNLQQVQHIGRHSESLAVNLRHAYRPSCHLTAHKDEDCKIVGDDFDFKPNFPSFFTRRQVIGTSSLLTSSLLLNPISLLAATEESTVSLVNTIDCLSDLPPIDTTKRVRLFLIRHGETDNNRLKIIQGARVDAPINDTGMQQAKLLGQALSRSSTPPEVFFHSPLQRAQQTADIAASQFSIKPPLRPLDTLKEFDFGDIAEGAPVEEMRSRMVATYTAWGMGDLDARMVEKGESGREILARIDSALNTLVDYASTSSVQTGCIAAVAHSSYLRLLLASVQPLSLLQASKLEQKNCCVNVIDFPKRNNPSPIRSKKKSIPFFLGGGGTPMDGVFEESVPITKQGEIIRINEKRHLELLS